MGHEDITTTEIYLHVSMGANGMGVKSPLDVLEEMGESVHRKEVTERATAAV